MASACLIVLSLLAINSGPGKRWLASYLSETLSANPRLDFQLIGLHGTLPSSIRLESINVSDSAGTIASARDVSARWSLWSILRGPFHVYAVSVNDVAILKRPPPNPDARPLDIVRAIPKALRGVRVDSFTINQLAVSEAVAGKRATFRIDGHLAGKTVEELVAALDVVRTDAPTTSATLTLNLGGGASTLGLAARVEDTAFLPELVGAEGQTPFVFTVDGDGDSNSWTGKVDGSLGGASFVNADLELAVGDTIQGSLDGIFHASRLPRAAALSERLGEVVAFQIDGQRRSDGSVALSPIKVSGGGSEFAGQLGYDAKADTVDLTVDLTTESLARVLGVTRNGLNQPAQGTVSLKGPLATPTLSTRLSVSRTPLLAVDGDLDLREGYGFDLDVAAWPKPPLIPEKAGEAIADGVNGHVAGMQRADGSLRIDESVLHVAGARLGFNADMNAGSHQLAASVNLSDLDISKLAGLVPDGSTGIVSLQGRIDGSKDGWNANATISGTSVEIKGATTAKLSGTLTGSGHSWKPSTLEGMNFAVDASAAPFTLNERSQPELRLRAEAAIPEANHLRLASAKVDSRDLAISAHGDYNIKSKGGKFGVNLSRIDLVLFKAAGHLSAQATIHTSTETPASGSLDFRVANAGGLPDPVLSLVTEQVDGKATFTLSDNSRLAIDNATLESSAMSASGTGVLDLIEKTMQTDTSFRVPNLAVLSEPMGRSLGGAIAASVSTKGPWDDFAATLAIDGDALVVDDAKVSHAELRGEVSGLPATPSGDATLRLSRDDEALSVEAAFAFAKPNLTVPNFTIESGSNQVRGNVEFDVESKHGQGAVTGDLPDLSAVGRMFDVNLAGGMKVNAVLEGPPDTEHLRVDLNGAQIGFADVSAGAVQANADINDPFGNWSGAIQVKGQSLEAGDANLAGYSVGMKGDKNTAELRMAINEGTVREWPVTLKTGMTASVSDGWLSVNSLDATLGGHQVTLAEPARASRSEDGATVDLGRIAVDDGEVGGAMNRDGENIAASFSLDALPLELVKLAGGPALEGTVGGQFDLEGEASQPTGNGSLRFRDVREPGAAYAPFAADVSASVDAGVCKASVKATMDDRISADASAELPVRFSFAPMDVGVDSGRTLRGTCKANADLSVFPQLLDLQDHVLQGRVKSELALGGTAAVPVITGETRIENGRYENLKTGTILDDLHVVIEGKDRELQVTEFNATDGAGGTLSAEGHVDVLPDKRFPFSLKANLANLRVANRDTISGQADGTFTVAGDMDKMDVTGAATIGPATVNIPKRLPGEYPELNVTEVNGPDDTSAPKQPEVKTDESPLTIALDVTCDAPGKVYVRSQSMDTEWKGNLHVGGTADAAEVTGTLSPVRGQIVFLDRTFDLRESAITLDGSTPPSPYLDLNAETRTADMTAKLHLYGVYPDVKLELQSEPALPQDEILAKLLFDRNLSDITPFQAVQLAAMLDSMRGNDGFSALTRTSRMLGNFRVQVRRQGEGVGETSVAVGKYLNDKVYVEVEQGLKDQKGGGRVEYQVTPRISIEGSADSEGKGNVGILYKKDY